MGQGLLAFAVHAAVHALWLVHDQDGLSTANQVDGALTARFLTGAVHLVLGLFPAFGLVRLFCQRGGFIPEFVDGADRDDHDLNVRAGRKVTHLAELVRVVLEEFVAFGTGVQGLEVLTGDLQCLVHPLFDGDRWHHNHELREAIALVQLEHGSQVHVGLARAGFHLHGEVQRQGRRQRLRRR